MDRETVASLVRLATRTLLTLDSKMVAMQMEALGRCRRDDITTTDFKENNAAFISSEEIQSSRLINQRGTAESKLARKAITQLNAWNGEIARIYFMTLLITVRQKHSSTFRTMEPSSLASETSTKALDRLIGASYRYVHSSNVLRSWLNILFQADESIRHYTGEEAYYRGGHGGRGSQGYVIKPASRSYAMCHCY